MSFRNWQNLYFGIICLPVIFFFETCKGQSANGISCYDNYNRAKKSLNNYYISNDKSLLDSSLQYSENALNCENTRRASIELKTSVLILLKDYKSGSEFINSLKKEDFQTPYGKTMYMNYFLAEDLKYNTQKKKSDSLLNATISIIQNTIRLNGADSAFVEGYYYDLFFIKSKLLPFSKIVGELDSLKIKFPDKADFIDALKETLKDL
jgi:hypothetical protein